MSRPSRDEAGNDVFAGASRYAGRRFENAAQINPRLRELQQ